MTLKSFHITYHIKILMIKFETITGKQYELNFSSDTKFIEIKRQLSEKFFHCDVNRIYLLFDGSVQTDDSKLSTINLEGNKRFIVVYIQPTGELPNIDEMVDNLLSIHPDRNTCLEALERTQYDIEAASNYLIDLIENPHQNQPSHHHPNTSHNHPNTSHNHPNTNYNHPNNHNIQNNNNTNNRNNNSNNNNKNNSSSNRGNQDGKIVQPSNNPFVYTSPQKNTPKPQDDRCNIEYPGLTKDEIQKVVNLIPPDFEAQIALDMFLDCGKDLNQFKEILGLNA
ncbi:hypothetical protein TRFO_35737 [Tritrichomonas foetus]|uniref:Ubiquitin-like domain-containing protein n=1 Tax=Tritrichomonas foetus TaxID=1144522 RepID=A0A1J4JK50_9EUKA|nr:hypothetical protein TRFO_35737 [Tritrichomonas foetus]|eukprot:OHS97941.1 hypothetical protein TRFO_35737 [Tritrichomonas foetus]